MCVAHRDGLASGVDPPGRWPGGRRREKAAAGQQHRRAQHWHLRESAAPAWKRRGLRGAPCWAARWGESPPWWRAAAVAGGCCCCSEQRRQRRAAWGDPARHSGPLAAAPPAGPGPARRQRPDARVAAVEPQSCTQGRSSPPASRRSGCCPLLCRPPLGGPLAPWRPSRARTRSGSESLSLSHGSAGEGAARSRRSRPRPCVPAPCSRRAPQPPRQPLCAAAAAADLPARGAIAGPALPLLPAPLRRRPPLFLQRYGEEGARAKAQQRWRMRTHCSPLEAEEEAAAAAALSPCESRCEGGPSAAAARAAAAAAARAAATAASAGSAAPPFTLDNPLLRLRLHRTPSAANTDSPTPPSLPAAAAPAPARSPPHGPPVLLPPPSSAAAPVAAPALAAALCSRGPGGGGGRGWGRPQGPGASRPLSQGGPTHTPGPAAARCASALCASAGARRWLWCYCRCGQGGCLATQRWQLFAHGRDPSRRRRRLTLPFTRCLRAKRVPPRRQPGSL